MATSYKDIFDAIMIRLRDNWTTPPTVHWPGVAFTPPGGAAWIQPRIVFTAAEQVTLGQNGQNRITGSLSVNVFTPIGDGGDEAAQHADTLRGLFSRGLSLAAGAKFITFRTPQVVPALEDEEWHQLPVECPFYLDETP